MQVVKVFLNNGEIHSYPEEDARVIAINKSGYLEIAKEQDDEGNLRNLVAGYPPGSWKYYRVFELKS